MAGLPESFPLKTLKELEDESYLKSFSFPYIKSSVPLNRAASSSSSGHRPRLLVCHDMKGGYLDDRFVQGSSNGDAYSIWHWQLIDIFVYFSHWLVTIPPPCWINTAHRHGVQVLGTFITEWNQGSDVCKILLESTESTEMYASRLADIAKTLGFDGWLINIENKVGEKDIHNLMEFVRLLTIFMHDRVPGSTVIWYDSVTKHGHLRWQNRLNDNNKCYFDLCDGIFTNYTWKEEYALESALKANARKCDVYMGIDVFGRNTFGGGEFHTNVALEAAKKAGVSAAIFAPGWVYETKQPPNFADAQNRWWGLVRECWPYARRYPIHLPFFSNFDQGFGNAIYMHGNKISSKPWSNLSCQNLQPLLDNHLKPQQGFLKSIVSREDPIYCGGSSVSFSGTIDDAAYCVTVLYEADVDVKDNLHVSYTAKPVGDSRMSLILKFNTVQTGTMVVLLVGHKEEEIISEVSGLQVLYPKNAVNVDVFHEWSRREYLLEVTGKLEGILAVSYLKKLEISKIIDLSKSDTSSDASTAEARELKPYQAWLGHVALCPSTHQHDFHTKFSFDYSNMLIEETNDKKAISLNLKWSASTPVDAEIFNYRIYVSSDVEDGHVHLGVAMVESFYVHQLPIPEGCHTLTFYLQVCCTSGFFSELEQSPSLEVRVI